MSSSQDQSINQQKYTSYQLQLLNNQIKLSNQFEQKNNDVLEMLQQLDNYIVVFDMSKKEDVNYKQGLLYYQKFASNEIFYKYKINNWQQLLKECNIIQMFKIQQFNQILHSYSQNMSNINHQQVQQLQIQLQQVTQFLPTQSNFNMYRSHANHVSLYTQKFQIKHYINMLQQDLIKLLTVQQNYMQNLDQVKRAHRPRLNKLIHTFNYSLTIRYLVLQQLFQQSLIVSNDVIKSHTIGLQQNVYQVQKMEHYLKLVNNGALNQLLTKFYPNQKQFSQDQVSHYFKNYQVEVNRLLLDQQQNQIDFLRKDIYNYVYLLDFPALINIVSVEQLTIILLQQNSQLREKLEYFKNYVQDYLNNFLFLLFRNQFEILQLTQQQINDFKRNIIEFSKYSLKVILQQLDQNINDKIQHMIEQINDYCVNNIISLEEVNINNLMMQSSDDWLCRIYCQKIGFLLNILIEAFKVNEQEMQMKQNKNQNSTQQNSTQSEQTEVVQMQNQQPSSKKQNKKGRR